MRLPRLRLLRNLRLQQNRLLNLQVHPSRRRVRMRYWRNFPLQMNLQYPNNSRMQP